MVSLELFLWPKKSVTLWTQLMLLGLSLGDFFQNDLDIIPFSSTLLPSGNFCLLLCKILFNFFADLDNEVC